MKTFSDWYFDLFESGVGSRLNQQEIAEDAWDYQQSKVDELQKRVDAALQLVNEMKGKRYPFSAYADQLEQALKGDQYDKHREKAEQAISNGASLTNHRIEL